MWTWKARQPEKQYPLALRILLPRIIEKNKQNFDLSCLIPQTFLYYQAYQAHCRSNELKIEKICKNLERRAQEAALRTSEGGLIECWTILKNIPSWKIYDLEILQKKIELEVLLSVAVRQIQHLKHLLTEHQKRTKNQAAWSLFVTHVIKSLYAFETQTPPVPLSTTLEKENRLGHYGFLQGILCINLHNRPDRWMEMCKQFETCKIPLDRVSKLEAVDFEIDGCVGCTDSHKFAAIYALLKRWYNVWILEDDSDQHARRHHIQLKEFFDMRMPFTVLMLHANIQKCVRPKEPKLVGKIRQIQEASLMDSYILDACMYLPMIACMHRGSQSLKSTGESWNYICDQYWKNLQKFCQPWYAMMPELSFQRADISDLALGFVNHEDINTKNKCLDDQKIDQIS